MIYSHLFLFVCLDARHREIAVSQTRILALPRAGADCNNLFQGLTLEETLSPNSLCQLRPNNFSAKI